MTRNILSFTTVVALGLSSAAVAQERVADANQPSYDCALYNECASNAPADEVERGKTRGWNLSRTLSNQPATPAKKSMETSAPRLVRPAPTSSSAAPVRRQRLATPAAAQSQSMARVRLAQGITFVSGSADLMPSATSNVEQLAVAMLRPDKLTQRFRIEGNTDSAGGRDMNMALSKRRATAVFDYLVAKGIDPSRLEVVGNGFDNLLNGVPSTAMANRRVEVKLVN